MSRTGEQRRMRHCEVLGGRQHQGQCGASRAHILELPGQSSFSDTRRVRQGHAELVLLQAVSSWRQTGSQQAPDPAELSALPRLRERWRIIRAPDLASPSGASLSSQCVPNVLQRHYLPAASAPGCAKYIYSVQIMVVRYCTGQRCRPFTSHRAATSRVPLRVRTGT